MTGTFLLESMPSEGDSTVFAINDIQWVTSTDREVTGTGILKLRLDGEPVQRLEIDLIVQGEARPHYDSGPVPVEVDFPNLYVVASMEGFCWFELVRLAAHPQSGVPILPSTWGRVKSLY